MYLFSVKWEPFQPLNTLAWRCHIKGRKKKKIPASLFVRSMAPLAKVRPAILFQISKKNKLSCNRTLCSIRKCANTMIFSCLDDSTSLISDFKNTAGPECYRKYSSRDKLWTVFPGKELLIFADDTEGSHSVSRSMAVTASKRQNPDFKLLTSLLLCLQNVKDKDTGQHICHDAGCHNRFCTKYVIH